VIAARAAVQRPRDAKLLVVGSDGALAHGARNALPTYVRSGDVIVANDAATIPASLSGTHERTGARIEVRLAGWSARGLGDPTSFVSVMFG
jgi:S-adenosylmethionine:tRNA ribosyltransferase-isomerase